MYTPMLPFQQVAQDLYQPRSFEAPPDRVQVPEAPQAWICYVPGAHGTAATFGEFMGTEAFRQARRQITRRIAECGQFVDTHFSEAGARSARASFDSFLEHLEARDGRSYFDDSKLQLLYSLGKRSLDDFCLLLHHPDIPLDQRKKAMYQLADQIGHCRGAGPAFVEALALLQQPEGSLRGQYWEALKALFDQTLQRYVVSMDHSGDPGWLEAMEIHVVNRLRLELGLPGADPHDSFSMGTLVTQEQVLACSSRLLTHCRPADAAALLAAQYRARLMDLAASELRVIGENASLAVTVPNGAHDLDLSVAGHMDAVLRAHRQLSSIYPGVTLHSLIEEEVDRGEFHWRQADTLLVRELMMELSRQGLIQPPVPQVAVEGGSGTAAWAVQHIDHRVPYVQHFRRSGGPGEPSNLQLPHLTALMKTPGVEPRLRRAAVDAVLRGEPGNVLLQLPVAWITSDEQLELLLHRLGRDGAVRWSYRQSLDGDALRRLLPTALRMGHVPLLKSLLVRLEPQPPAVVMTLGGPQVLHQAAMSGSLEALLLWGKVMRSAAPELSWEQVAAAFNDKQGRNAALPLLRSRQAPMLEALLSLAVDVSKAKPALEGLAAQHLEGLMQEAMRHHPLPTLQMLAACALKAAEAGVLAPELVCRVIDGASGREGCTRAVEANRPMVVRWFHGMVLSFASRELITREQTEDLLAGQAWFTASPVELALTLHRPACLSAHLMALIGAAGTGQPAADPLPGHPCGAGLHRAAGLGRLRRVDKGMGRGAAGGPPARPDHQRRCGGRAEPGIRGGGGRCR